MRYADGPGTQCEVFVQAPVERVWALVADIGLPARLSPELQRVAWLDGADGPALGARFEGHNARPNMRDWRTVSEVVELAEHRAFAWAVMDADGRFGDPVSEVAGSLARWRFDLIPEDGGTRLRQSVVIGPGRSGVILAIEARPEAEEKIVDFRLGELRTGMTATLEGVKSLAEAES
ncbi:SRPBCC family protein [Kitasatospora cathayae]|uniref:SRPBCC family protein n=1 Tax=Kitasatospora cathayae TaxID=3004092 RepID=A0ABY7PYK5_9ACTN|nr:SRPBCC family protein [Kitasatospora sp. HUAS 3-15]WBP85518.1 SRPBCC family protein [Kitasatospora sp. HUAS 3-15]